MAEFTQGRNPFNDYDLGVFIGHGIACSGGHVVTPGGTIYNLPPQHYYPLMLDRATKTAHWVGSSWIPQYGAAGGKLKWMFLMTCNPLLDNGPNGIYNQNKANGTLPFGSGLRVLCGYNSKIYLERNMGGYLSDALIHRINGEQYRDGTVVNAWGYVWNRSSNRNRGFIARAVYWPECENDRIYGAKDGANDAAHVPPLQPHASQTELEETDFLP